MVSTRILGKTMRDAVRNKDRWKRRRAPTQDPSTDMRWLLRVGAGLTHATVGGAGHLVPMDQPAAAQDMITRFVRGTLH